MAAVVIAVPVGRRLLMGVCIPFDERKITDLTDLSRDL